MNLPICAVLIVGTQKFIPESTSAVAKKLDYAGVVTFSAGLFLLTWAAIDGNALGWTSQVTTWRLAGGIVLLLLFVFVERMQQEPMVDFSVLSTSRFIGSAFAMLGYSGGAQVMIFYLPLYLQNTYGYAPAKAGLAMLPFAFPMFLIPKLGARLSGKISSRSMLGIALALTASANFLMALLSTFEANYWMFAVAMILAGMGSGVSATVRFTGLLLSVAGLGAVLGATTVKIFSEKAADLGLTSAVAKDLAKNFVAGEDEHASASSTLLAQHHDALRHAFDIGFSYTSFGAAVIAALSLVLMYLILPRESSTSRAEQSDSELVVVPGE